MITMNPKSLLLCHCRKSSNATCVYRYTSANTSASAFPFSTTRLAHSASRPSTPVDVPRGKRVVVLKDLVVSPDEYGMRLDRFLKHRIVQEQGFKGVSSLLINKWLRKKQVRLLGQNDKYPGNITADSECQPLGTSTQADAHSVARTVTSGSTRTQLGQTWRIRALWDVDQSSAIYPTSNFASADGSAPTAHAAHEERIRLLPLQNWIVYKDERIIVLNKPAGVAVQGGTGIKVSVHDSLPVLRDGYPEDPRLVHRLDMTTSGLLILARTRKAAQDLTRRFHDGTAVSANTVDVISNPGISKKYMAVVSSVAPITIPNSSLQGGGKAADGLFTMRCDMIITSEGKRQVIRVHGHNDAAPSSIPHGPYTVWNSVTDARIASQSFHDELHWALLELHPRTGRKHQLRIHCAQLLHAPILGDIKYARGKDHSSRGDGKQERVFLHMAELTLKSWFADTGEVLQSEVSRDFIFAKNGSLTVRAAVPQDMQYQVNLLGLKTTT